MTLSVLSYLLQTTYRRAHASCHLHRRAWPTLALPSAASASRVRATGRALQAPRRKTTATLNGHSRLCSMRGDDGGYSAS